MKMRESELKYYKGID